MKNYPFLRTLIKMYWLFLFIAIGLLSIAFTNTFFPEKSDALVETTNVITKNEFALSPELLETIANGKKLFRTNCATCHNKNMKSDMTGPALAGLQNRWSDYPESDLYAWIRNSAKLRDTGHPKAVALYAKWKVSMNSFNTLTDEDIKAILVYIDNVK